jgi:hypothetical protein
VAGGIDLAGLFPRYIDIRRGAIITFVAAWVREFTVERPSCSLQIDCPTMAVDKPCRYFCSCLELILGLPSAANGRHVRRLLSTPPSANQAHPSLPPERLRVLVLAWSKLARYTCVDCGMGPNYWRFGCQRKKGNECTEAVVPAVLHGVLSGSVSSYYTIFDPVDS